MHAITTATVAAAPLAADGNSGGGFGSWILPAVILLALVYFFTAQRRRSRAAQDEQSKLGPGALIMTRGGLYGTIVEVDGQDILLEIAPDVVCRFTRQAIGRVVSASPDAGATVLDTPGGPDDGAVSLDKTREDAADASAAGSEEPTSAETGSPAASDAGKDR